MRKTILLIDGDVLAYKTCACVETQVEDEDGYWYWFCNGDEVKVRINAEIGRYLDELGADDYVLALTDDQVNFRKDILPSYKGNRAGVKRPVALRGIREWMQEEHRTYLRPRLEGDDVLGILATWPKFVRENGRPIIVSIDKDMRCIPCTYVRDLDTGPVEITEEAADRWHMIQTLAGDQTDGYGGCPGIGLDRAIKAVDERLGVEPYEYTFKRGARKGETETRYAEVPMDDLWDVVVSRYDAAGLSEEVALEQARVARILRYSDYDLKRKEPILWVPGRERRA